MAWDSNEFVRAQAHTLILRYDKGNWQNRNCKSLMMHRTELKLGLFGSLLELEFICKYLSYACSLKTKKCKSNHTHKHIEICNRNSKTFSVQWKGISNAIFFVKCTEYFGDTYNKEPKMTLMFLRYWARSNERNSRKHWISYCLQ